MKHTCGFGFLPGKEYTCSLLELSEVPAISTRGQTLLSMKIFKLNK